MSSDDSNHSPESDVTDMNFSDTELTLGLPGGREVRPSSSIGVKSGCTKRGYSETVDLNLGTSIRNSRGDTQIADKSETDTSSTGKSPATKAQEVVGWPPVRPCRKNAMTMKRCTYVKVAVDGAPYLRKVDLDIYGSYQELLRALEELFSCFTISSNYMYGIKSIDTAKGTEYVPTYEDKDGDWMLVGDVPWKMFIESCKRIRLMKSTEPEAIDYLAPKTTPNCTSSS